jgi:hypothetical protein
MSSLMLVAGSGGALLDLLALRPWWSLHETTWVAVRAADTEVALAGETVRWHAGEKAWGAVRHLRASRADLVVSSSPRTARPYFVAARLLRVPTIWVEPLTAAGPPGWCARKASAVVVQNPALLADRPGAVLIGELY